MERRPRAFRTLLRLFAILVPLSAFAQGDLNPPAAPTPTMKTLQQVEPRTDLQATPAPAGVDTSNSNFHFVINQAGSYYLSSNLAVTKTSGIQINAENVTLDLNGFHISRASGSGGNGIEIVTTAHRASVRNGSIKGFARGVQSVSSLARACAFRDLSVANCTSAGIAAGPYAVLESCRVHDGTGSSGISAGNGSTLTNCVAAFNTVTGSAINANIGSSLTNCVAANNTVAASGIFASDGSSLINCAATNNTVTGSGISSAIGAGVGSTLTNCVATNNTAPFGIFANNGSSLTNCTAYANTSSESTSAGIGVSINCTITRCTASHNTSSAATSTATTGMGFDLPSRCTIQGSTAASNEGDGIEMFSANLARDNTCSNNGVNGNGAGIHITGNDNRIEANNVTGNDRGIDVDAEGNYIIKNSASGNSPNYDIAAGNIFGEIVDRVIPAGSPTPPPVSGNSAASTANTTDPWANISY